MEAIISAMPSKPVPFSPLMLADRLLTLGPGDAPSAPGRIAKCRSAAAPSRSTLPDTRAVPPVLDNAPSPDSTPRRACSGSSSVLNGDVPPNSA